MLFLAIFWAFFHSALTPTVELGAQWPPMGIERAPEDGNKEKELSSVPPSYPIDCDEGREHLRRLLPIRVFWWIARCICDVWPGLPQEDNGVSGFWHGDDKKLVTHNHNQPSGSVRSRIERRYFSSAVGGGSNTNSCRKAEWSSHIGCLKGNEQAPKSIWTINIFCCQLREITATTCMRKRSLRKGDSQDKLETIIIDSGQEKPSPLDKLVKESGKVGVTTIISKALGLRDLKGHKHYNLIEFLANPRFLEKCYSEIRSKPGNMTKGITMETLDRINWSWFEKAAEDLKTGKWKFKLSRRVEIPKANGSTRPLGIASPREKIVQKGLHAILETIFEPTFSPSSHGFRPGRSVHSALLDIYLMGNKCNWVVQGDISKCFDRIPHDIILKLIGKKIGDPRIMQLIAKFLNAGFKNTKGSIERPKLGTPQGGILSPLLANIVLNQLDEFMQRLKTKFDRGVRRMKNPVYAKLQAKRGKSTDLKERSNILRMMRRIRRTDMFDPKFRRIWYVRYADDFVALVLGSKNDAIYIKSLIKNVLRDKCGLELNDEKTIVSNAKEKCKFLGAEIRNLDVNPTWLVNHKKGRNVGVAHPLINAPVSEILKKLKKANLIKQNSKGEFIPTGLTALMNLSHHEILTFYNAKIRGLLNFYSFASNYSRLHQIFWLLKASCALSLAKKYKIRTLSKIFKKFGPLLECTETGLKFYKPETLKVAHDFKVRKPVNVDRLVEQTWFGKDTRSVFDEACTICGSTAFVEMHHIRSVKDIRARFSKGDKVTAAQFGGCHNA